MPAGSGELVRHCAAIISPVTTFEPVLLLVTKITRVPTVHATILHSGIPHMDKMT